MAFYFQLFWLPAGVSAILLALVWIEGDLPVQSVWIKVAWFLFALALQAWVPTTAAWILGLTLQTALAIVLLFGRRLGSL